MNVLLYLLSDVIRHALRTANEACVHVADATLRTVKLALDAERRLNSRWWL